MTMMLSMSSPIRVNVSMCFIYGAHELTLCFLRVHGKFCILELLCISCFSPHLNKSYDKYGISF